MCSHVTAGKRIIERNDVACGELAAGAKFGPGPRPVLRYSTAAARFETLVTQSGADHSSHYRPSSGVTARRRREIMSGTPHWCSAPRTAVRYTSIEGVTLERHPARRAHVVQFVVHESVGTHQATISQTVPTLPSLSASAGRAPLADLGRYSSHFRRRAITPAVADGRGG